MCASPVKRNRLRTQFRGDEQIILGHVLHSSVSRSADKVEVGDSLPLVEDYVKSIENELRLLRTESRGAKEIPPFPLHSTSDNVMSKGMLEELKMSWKNYHEHFEPELKTTTDMLLGLFHTLLTEVSFDVLKWKSTYEITSSLQRIAAMIAF
ncbi:hypothetical protein PsorP6_010700 [Peronosclerospora sorghi]|uniref:Uncharacterized protein n=1 Tax=Peronosclerospora sorghi TaxID=230839 RepID=A0ACC0VUP6_9STRA|nr:hypothetical protein PsorP6_010700 [Peronosclerospora sorghi]